MRSYAHSVSVGRRTIFTAALRNTPPAVRTSATPTRPSAPGNTFIIIIFGQMLRGSPGSIIRTLHSSGPVFWGHVLWAVVSVSTREPTVSKRRRKISMPFVIISLSWTLRNVARCLDLQGAGDSALSLRNHLVVPIHRWVDESSRYAPLLSTLFLLLRRSRIVL